MKVLDYIFRFEVASPWDHERRFAKDFKRFLATKGFAAEIASPMEGSQGAASAMQITKVGK